MTVETRPPESDELEISVFGPGIGECIVIHLGGGQWMVVDSCLGADRATAVAIEYLQGLTVDLAEQVKLIVVTHWHDDHVRGISQLVEQCPSARFACSVALNCEEFARLIAAHEHVKLIEHTSGVSEFSSILDCINRRSRGRDTKGPDCWVGEGTVLHSDEDSGVEVRGLSPSAQAITDSKLEIARLLPEPGQTIRRFPHVTPNGLSVALIVRTSGVTSLLGADLERGRSNGHGWQAVVASAVRPSVASSVFKVAHHGSPNAEFSDMWGSVIAENPFAVVTPYARGRTPRPSEADVRRIKSKPAVLHCTTWPLTKRPPRRRDADKTMKEVARNRLALQDRFGHVRYRVRLYESPEAISCELFGSAATL